MSFKKLDPRTKRKVRIRKKISGCAAKPRLTVFRSNKYIYAQLIDDQAGATLACASSLEIAKESGGKNLSSAEAVGKLVAERAIKNKIEHVVFDRNGYCYHGVIKKMADAARASGLKF